MVGLGLSGDSLVDGVWERCVGGKGCVKTETSKGEDKLDDPGSSDRRQGESLRLTTSGGCRRENEKIYRKTDKSRETETKQTERRTDSGHTHSATADSVSALNNLVFRKTF